jgi:hypothetical protein
VRHLRLLLLSAVIALTVTAAGEAAAIATRATGSQAFELYRGKGQAVVAKRGAVLGGVGRGKIKIKRMPGGPAPQGYVTGCERRYGSWSDVLVCRGRALRFYVHDGNWRLRLRGRGINASGVVRGYLSLGPLPAAAGSAGWYSLGGRAYRPWPVTWQTFRLAT